LFFFFCFWVLGIELRLSHKHSTTWAMSTAQPFYLYFVFCTVSLTLTRLALNFPSNWDYMHGLVLDHFVFWDFQQDFVCKFDSIT
jgi:hypothetical protein